MPGDEAFFKAAQPLIEHLGLHFERAKTYLNSSHYIFQGTQLSYEIEDQAEEPISFIACVNNDEILNANLLSSPCLRKTGSPHQLIIERNCSSAAEGFSRGIQAARNDLVVMLHQDMYLPRGWPNRFLQQYRYAEKLFGKIGVAGVVGMTHRNNESMGHGYIVDGCSIKTFQGESKNPVPVDTLDEVLLAVPRNTPLRLDPSLGFHFYGGDICLAARQAGLPVVALDALCFHNAININITFSAAFYKSREIFKNKWIAELPIATTCTLIKKEEILSGKEPLLVKDCQKVVSDSGNNALEKAKVLNKQGAELFAKDDIQGALNAFTKAIEINPNFAGVHNNLAILYWQTGQPQKAADHFSKALQIDPDDRNTVINCIQLLKAYNKIQDAKALCTSFLQRNPDDEVIGMALRELQKIIEH